MSSPSQSRGRGKKSKKSKRKSLFGMPKDASTPAQVYRIYAYISAIISIAFLLTADDITGSEKLGRLIIFLAFTWFWIYLVTSAFDYLCKRELCWLAWGLLVLPFIASVLTRNSLNND